MKGHAGRFEREDGRFAEEDFVADDAGDGVRRGLRGVDVHGFGAEHERVRGVRFRLDGLVVQLHAEFAGSGLEHGPVAVGRQAFRIQEIRVAEERRGEFRGRAAVKGPGCAELEDAAVLHDCDAVAHAQGFTAVVGHVECGQAPFLADPADFAPHEVAETCVEVGERFVEEQDGTAEGEGARECDALLLAAGKLVDLAFRELRHADHGEHFPRGLRDLLAREFAELEAEFDVARHVQVRPQRVVLEYHRRVPRLRRQAGDVAPVQHDRAGILPDEPGHDAQERGFAAARGTEEKHEFAGLHREIDGTQDRRVRVGLGNAAKFKHRHGRPQRKFSNVRSSSQTSMKKKPRTASRISTG